MQLTKREQKLVRQAQIRLIGNLISGALLIGIYLAGFGYMMIR